MLQGTDVIDATERRNFIFFLIQEEALVKLEIVRIAIDFDDTCCGMRREKAPPPPRGYADGHGGWCEPDLKLRLEALRRRGNI